MSSFECFTAHIKGACQTKPQKKSSRHVETIDVMDLRKVDSVKMMGCYESVGFSGAAEEQNQIHRAGCFID